MKQQHDPENRIDNRESVWTLGIGAVLSFGRAEHQASRDPRHGSEPSRSISGDRTGMRVCVGMRDVKAVRHCRACGAGEEAYARREGVCAVGTHCNLRRYRDDPAAEAVGVDPGVRQRGLPPSRYLNKNEHYCNSAGPNREYLKKKSKNEGPSANTASKMAKFWSIKGGRR
jgi:hypothetical protein